MSIQRVFRSAWFTRALILIVSHALAVQFSQNAATDATPPADVIIAAPSGEGNFPADFTGENSGIAIGAPITWSAPQNITGDTNVSIAGSLVGAFNVGDGGVGAATVNGVTFNPFALNSTGGPVSSGTVGNFTLATPDLFESSNSLYGSATGSFAGLSAGYQTLLRSGTMVSNFIINPATFTLTMGGLTLGHHYQFQWFANLSGPGAQLRSATAGNTITLNDNVTNLEGGLGQYAIGSFVADALTEVITFSSVGTGDQAAQINAFQLRDLDVVPEPTGTVLMLLGLGVMVCRRRRPTA